jgi:hypothetical protein
MTGHGRNHAPWLFASLVQQGDHYLFKINASHGKFMWLALVYLPDKEP